MESKSTPPNILLVDDHEQVRQMLRITLERSGYHVEEACNGKEALAHVQAKKPDAVVMDIVMPEMEGLETIVKMRHIQPDIKVIAISGAGKNSPKVYLESALRLGATHAFAKPVDREELISALEGLLQQ